MNTAVQKQAEVTLLNPHIHFETRKGLFATQRFNECVLTKQPRYLPNRGLDGVTSIVLPRSMTDKQIIDEMLGGMKEAREHAITLDQIVELRVARGYPEKNGVSLNNDGRTNLFYLLAGRTLIVVLVTWDAHLGWYVDSKPLGERGKWCAGNRVFRNTKLKL